jgi:CHAT domain-containing protein
MADLKLRRAKDSTGTPALMLVAFGDPDLGHAGPARRQAAMMNEKLTPLPEAERQVRMLRQIYGLAQSRIYIGAEATEERVRKEAAASRILHLATHGVVDDKSPMYSYVVLSQSRVNENEDGLLEAREIMDLNLNCDLVVLAACNTAGGRISKGEGVVGLAWSFFIGGSPAIVVSQWAVESSSTTALMIEFHKTLKAATEGRMPGAGKAEALRIAALKLLRTPRYRHPFYWAPFVVVGDDRPPSPSVRRL